MENMYRHQIKTSFSKHSLVTLILGGTLFSGMAASAPSAPTPSELCASSAKGENCVSAPNTSDPITPQPVAPITNSPMSLPYLWTNSFETADWNKDLIRSGNKTTVVANSSRQTCDRNNEARFFIDYNRGTTFRTEVTLGGKYGQLKTGEDYWAGFSIYLPADWAFEADPAAIDILFQVHARPDLDLNEAYRGPILSLFLKTGNWYVGWAKDPKQVSYRPGGKWQRTPGTQKGGASIGAYKTGKWTDFVFHFTVAPTGNGVVEVWKDGKKVLSKSHGVGYNDKKGPYFKFGNYKPSWNKTKSWSRPSKTFSTRTHYVDDIRIGDSRASYNIIAPTCR